MLTLEHVTATKGTFTLNADITINPGQKLAIIGPSGSGKSTLLDVIAGFLPVTNGKVIWKGQDLTTAPPGARPVSLLFQDNNLFPHLTIAQNTGLGLRPDLKLNAAQKTQVEDALARVGLSGRGTDKPGALSGGQQSRAALARVLLQGTPLVLLDEPFSALGPALKAEMLALLADVLSDTRATLLMVTHDPADAMAVAKNLVLVADGVAHAAVDVVTGFENPTPALKAYLGGS